MKSISILIFIVLLSAPIHSQFGFLGKRNSVTLGLSGYTPILSGSYRDVTYKLSNNQLKSASERFNYAGYLSYSIAAKKRLSLGVDGEFRVFGVLAPRYYVSTFLNNEGSYVASDTTFVRMNSISVQSISILPKFEFYSKNGISSVGLSHQLGVGFSLLKLVNKNYDYSIYEYSSTNSSTWTPPDIYTVNKDWDSYKAISFLYAINMRIPFSDHLAFNFGISYTANISIKPSDEQFEKNKDPFLSYSDIYYQIQRENLVLIQIKSGLTYFF